MLFPITLKGNNLLYPADLLLLYDTADQLVNECKRRGCLPKDIEATWPNVLGFMRRIPGQEHYRAAPNGVDDCPTRQEIIVFRDALMIHATRCRRALVNT